MNGWSGQMDGWHMNMNSGWMSVSLVVVAGLVAVVWRRS